MDYLIQAKTFFHRARDAAASEEKDMHIEAGLAMLMKAIAEREKARPREGGQE